jgi:MtrB/PioB family decaheme-associated outer membrane protein
METNMRSRSSSFACFAAGALVGLTTVSMAYGDEPADPASPNGGTASVSVGAVSQVNPLFRDYSGINQTGAYGLLNVDFVNRDPQGDWLRAFIQNLGLDGNEQLGASYEKQGDWHIDLGYNQITTYAPYTLQTKVNGVGTADLTLNPDFRSSKGLGPVSNLDLQRNDITLSGSKTFGEAFRINFALVSEEKSGEMIAAAEGNGLTGLTPANSGVPAAGKTYATQFFAPQPENYQHTQASASIDYFSAKWQGTVGYYGSFFVDNNTALTTFPGTDPAVTSKTLSTQVPQISLPPSNHAQQLYAEAAYNLTDSSRLTFKATGEQLVQDMGFIPSIADGGVDPRGVVYAKGITNGNLGGLVDTKTLATRFTSHIMKDLDLVASWRYENRDDDTPVRPYTVSEGTTYFNTLDSYRSNDGKVDLSYRLPLGYRISGGFEYKEVDTPGQLRELVKDDIFHLQLMKSMGEGLNGTFKLFQDTRSGGPWNPEAVDVSSTCACFPTVTNVTAPLEFGNRTRDGARLMLDWSPLEALSLQLYAEAGIDQYTSSPYGQSEVPGYQLRPMGLLSARTQSLGLDGSYALNENWSATSFVSYNLQKTAQHESETPRITGTQTCSGAGTIAADQFCVPWSADLDMEGKVVGFGVKGQISVWTVRAKYMYEKDLTSYDIAFNPSGALSPVPAGAGNLPDTFYTINSLQLSGSRALTKNTRLIIGYIYDIRRIDDYTWRNWTFSDGTTVFQSPNQITQAVRVTLAVRF